MASETDALATIAAAVAIMWLGGKVKSLAKETDAEIITMQDYTIEVKPVRPARAPAGQASEPWGCYSSEKHKHDLCEVRKGESDSMDLCVPLSWCVRGSRCVQCR